MPLGKNSNTSTIITITEVVPLDVEEPELDDSIATMMRLSEVKQNMPRREEEHLLERFGHARINEEEVLQLVVIAIVPSHTSTTQTRRTTATRRRRRTPMTR